MEVHGAGAGSAIIVGGGYIGLEMAEAFTARGLAVTLVEQAPAVMPSVDLELGRLLGEELARHDVVVVNDVIVKAIHYDAGGLTVSQSWSSTSSPSALIPQAVSPVLVETAWVGPAGATRPALKAVSGRWTRVGTCWSCSVPTL